jgi:hypothetical protein
MFDTPVLFIVFNRPSTTTKVFEAIREVQPSRLYIAGDAPRPGNASDLQKCAEVRDIVRKVDWNCSVEYLFQENNLGCSLGPRAAFKWFFDREEEGIILEDDCLPNRSFFLFCKEMLEKYRHDPRIISINGSNLGYQIPRTDSYTFSLFMNMWGWATWRRSAEKIDYNLAQWKTEKMPLYTMYKRLRQNVFDLDINWYRYWQHKFDLTVQRENFSWWDWQWIYHQTRDKQLSIVPGKNLVTNIGFTDEATHTKAQDNPAAFLAAEEMTFPLNHPVKVKRDLTYEEEKVKWVWCYHKRTSFPGFVINNIKERLKK